MNFLALAETLAASENEDTTPLPIAKIAKKAVIEGENLSFGNSGNFGNFGKHQGEETRQSPDTLILTAVRSGNHRPGPIAIATGLGATRAYQTINRMLSEGLIHQAKDGILSVVSETPTPATTATTATTATNTPR